MCVVQCLFLHPCPPTTPPPHTPLPPPYEDQFSGNNTQYVYLDRFISHTFTLYTNKCVHANIYNIHEVVPRPGYNITHLGNAL